jgi:prefoldin subunit 5
MNIDERLEKLVERHEALTQSVEMLTSDLRELKTLVNDIANGTARLLHVAELHDQRISRLEGNQR